MKQQTNYTVGFLFNKKLKKVALIRKQRPEWQKGKLNGIGGHIEDGEIPSVAQTREFFEETGLSYDGWVNFCRLNGDDFCVYCFSGIGDLSSLQTKTDETVEIVSVAKINKLKDSMIENLPWLIALAIDNINDGRPSF